MSTPVSGNSGGNFGGHFSGRTIAVTGGASGIGRACCELLAERGARVLVLDRDAAGARAAARALGAEDHVLDVADGGAVEALAAALWQRHGAIDGLINSAGIIQGDAAPPERLALATFDRVFEVNLRGTHAACVAFGARMARRGQGAIVNLASIAGVASTPLHAYGPMKAAIIGLTRNLAAEWGPSGVRVNCLSPGPVLTPALQAAIDSGQRDPAKMRAAAATGNIVTPREVALAAAFLLSAEASAITGVNLPVDHGWLVANSWTSFGGLRTPAASSPPSAASA